MGICGGVPDFIDGNIVTKVFLGDVIISTRVVEYTKGTQYPDHFEEKYTLRQAPEEIRKHLNKVAENQYHFGKLQKDTSSYLSATLPILQEQETKGREWGYLGANNDKLFEMSHRHKHHTSGICETCDRCEKDEDEVCRAALSHSCATLKCSETVSRRRLTDPGVGPGSMSAPMAERSALIQDPELQIFFGLVACGDGVMKSWFHRNAVVSRERLADHKIIAFEMEGAGAWEMVPTVVIKGVSDYADSHKRDDWQPHAAARAAACAKAFLDQWTRTDGEDREVEIWKSCAPYTNSEWSTVVMASARR